MSSPTLLLSNAAKVEVTDLDIVITVPAGSADDRMIEKVFTEGKTCRLLHDGMMTKLQLVQFKRRDGLVIWHGVT